MIMQTKALTQFQGKLKDGDGEFYLNEAEPDAEGGLICLQ